MGLTEPPSHPRELVVEECRLLWPQLGPWRRMSLELGEPTVPHLPERQAPLRFDPLVVIRVEQTLLALDNPRPRPEPAP